MYIYLFVHGKRDTDFHSTKVIYTYLYVLYACMYMCVCVCVCVCECTHTHTHTHTHRTHRQRPKITKSYLKRSRQGRMH